MFSVKKVLTKYFYYISIFFALIDFTYNSNEGKVKTHLVLKICSNILLLLFLIILPMQMKLLITYLFRESSHPEIIAVVWSLEYISLFIFALALYGNVLFNREEIRKICNIGIMIHKNTDDQLLDNERKMLKILFCKIFLIDNCFMCFNMISNMSTMFANFATAFFLSYVLNFLSSIVFNAFIYVLLLIKFEFDKVNNSVRESIKKDEHESFLNKIAEYKRLAAYCKRVIKIFSKCFIVNFLYAIVTTCSGVSKIFYIYCCIPFIISIYWIKFN